MSDVDGEFVWRLIAAGAEDRFSDGFEGRAEAEAWLGGAWEELAADGIEEVELFERTGDEDEGRPLYRMSLDEG